MNPFRLLFTTIPILLAACGPSEISPPDPTGLGGSGSTGQGGGGQGGAGMGGEGQGGENTLTIDTILAEVSANPDAGMHKYAASHGWPVPVESGYLFVSTDPSLCLLAGSFNQWTGSEMKPQGNICFAHTVVAPGSQYKFTNGSKWAADPWARSYTYDGNGEMSLVMPTAAHLDRFFKIGDAQMPERTVNVWVPQEKPTHVLYVHDGQNLFDPQAAWGGWGLQDSVPSAMMLVGIDNTGEGRMFEYTHVPDVLDLDGDGTAESWGGKGDAYADYVNGTVRKLITDRYGEPAKVGTMGSSLGGLISLHIVDRFPGQYAYAASLSGTLGWGKIGATSKNETMIERYVAHGHQSTVLYLDAGGGNPALTQQQNEALCMDADGDGIEDDNKIGDNACENAQMREALVGVGYQPLVDMFHWWEPGAAHNEAEWRARVFRPLDLFSNL